MWERVGLMLLRLLIEGIAKGVVAPKVTEGLLILLAKKGGPLLIGNKRTWSYASQLCT